MRELEYRLEQTRKVVGQLPGPKSAEWDARRKARCRLGSIQVCLATWWMPMAESL